MVKPSETFEGFIFFEKGVDKLNSIVYTIDVNEREVLTMKAITSNCTLITSNARFDFYVEKVHNGRDWYTLAFVKGTEVLDSMAGFSTKKVAVECAHSWAEHMGA